MKVRIRLWQLYELPAKGRKSKKAWRRRRAFSLRSEDKTFSIALTAVFCMNTKSRSVIGAWVAYPLGRGNRGMDLKEDFELLGSLFVKLDPLAVAFAGVLLEIHRHGNRYVLLEMGTCYWQPTPQVFF